MEESIAAQFKRKKKGYFIYIPSSGRAVRASPTLIFAGCPKLVICPTQPALGMIFNPQLGGYTMNHSIIIYVHSSPSKARRGAHTAHVASRAFSPTAITRLFTPDICYTTKIT